MIAQSLLGRTIVSTRAREVGLRIFAILFIFTLFVGGVQLRRWTGQNTRHVRYQHDIVNAFYWGQETLKEARRLSPEDASANSWTGLFRGYLALYDRVKEEAYDERLRPRLSAAATPDHGHLEQRSTRWISVGRQ